MRSERCGYFHCSSKLRQNRVVHLFFHSAQFPTTSLHSTHCFFSQFRYAELSATVPICTRMRWDSFENFICCLCMEPDHSKMPQARCPTPLRAVPRPTCNAVCHDLPSNLGTYLFSRAVDELGRVSRDHYLSPIITCLLRLTEHASVPSILV